MAGFDDEEFSKLQATHYRGLVRVRLNALSFGHILVQQQHRQLCPNNVGQIQKIFEKPGCLRLQKEHFINAIIDDRSLDDAVAVSRVSREELTSLNAGLLTILPLLLSIVIVIVIAC
ncbi:hypothetical protein DM02DRAFT_621125 [Periconia macrospinosa]|uniref:Uncharacterized protein n=1 Tax=Periconia macrospinosa TaxID=97972 RepID=A0A2V1CWW9_9PLEO|nr:hypothetical protein DM02DRAFT_621125 [Periconia macrospinosa]